MNDVLYFQKQEAVRAFPQVVLRLVVVEEVEEVVPASFMLNLDIYVSQCRIQGRDAAEKCRGSAGGLGAEDRPRLASVYMKTRAACCFKAAVSGPKRVARELWKIGVGGSGIERSQKRLGVEVR